MNRRNYQTTSGVAVIVGVALMASASFAGASVASGKSARSNSHRAAHKGCRSYTNVTMVDASFPPDPAIFDPTVARLKGYFKANCLNVTETSVGGSTLAVAAIESGHSQFAVGNVNTTATANAHGANVVGIVGDTLQFPGEIVSAPSITKVSQLNGATWGIAAYGTTDYWTPLAYFRKAGGANPATFKYVVLQNSTNEAAALVAGKIDAAWFVQGQGMSLLAKDPSLHVLVPPNKLDPAVPASGAFVDTSKSFYQQDPKAVDEFVKAVIEANRAIYRSESLFIQMSNQITPGKYTTAQLKQLYKALRPSLGVNGALNRYSFSQNHALWQRYIDPKDANNPYFTSYAQFVETKPAQLAVDQLGLMKHVLDKPMFKVQA